jgi:hypothetical protein
MKAIRVGRCPLPLGNLYEYQKKRLRKFEIRKCLILNEMSLSEQKGETAGKQPGKKKSGSKLPHSKRGYLRD